MEQFRNGLTKDTHNGINTSTSPQLKVQFLPLQLKLYTFRHLQFQVALQMGLKLYLNVPTKESEKGKPVCVCVSTGVYSKWGCNCKNFYLTMKHTSCVKFVGFQTFQFSITAS